MKVRDIHLVDPEGRSLKLPKAAMGKLFIRTYLPAYFEMTLDGQVDLHVPVHSVEVQDGAPQATVTYGQQQDLFADVGAFHEKFGVRSTQAGDPPSWPTGEEMDFRIGFMEEELREFCEAVEARDMAIAADALADLTWVALGTAHVMGIPFPAIWAEVVRANMAKVRADPDGDPRSTRSAKFDVVKPEGWQPPDHGPALRAAGFVDEKLGLGEPE